MEFKFSVNDIFKSPIVEINHGLIPPGFTGDRRTFWDVVGKVSEVINAMGEASAAAQGLTKPITTSERLRNSEHTVYLLIDKTAGNGRGAVTGMLKTGKKGLYVFDRNGQHYQVSPPCVLDFYVHESRQRTGLGKRLFEHMLQTENIEPVKMAIDRPSDKFLGFLNKHYTLSNPVKQMNNYVVFDGFFPSSPEKNGTVEHSHSGDTPGKKQSANGLQTTSYTSPLGRYGAPRPPCSMGQIIHNQTSTIPKNTEPTGVNSVRSAPETNFQSIPGNSPGYPTTVTQSTPNIYYRSPEQQNPNMVQTRQNYQQSQPQITNNPNEVKYYQQQQSNNVWQSLGNVPPNPNLDHKTNFNRQAPYYYGPQQSIATNNQQLQDAANSGQYQNYINHPGEGAAQQSQAIEGQGQAMYQNAPQYMQNTVQTPSYMLQTQSPLPPQNMQQYPSQYAARNNQQTPQNMIPQTAMTPNAVQKNTADNSQIEIQPQMQRNNFVTPQAAQYESSATFQHNRQLPQQNYPQISYQQNVEQTNNFQNQQMPPQQNSAYQQNIDPTTYNNMNAPQNQQMTPQQNSAYQQNIDPTTYNNMNAPQNQQMTPQQNSVYQPTLNQNQPSVMYSNMNIPQNQPTTPQQNMTQFGLPSTQYSYSTPQTSLENTQPYVANPNVQMQPGVTQSVPETNILPQYNNQIVLNQPQNAPLYNVANPISLPNINGVNETAQYSNQATLNQPQNVPSAHLTKPTLSQPSMPNTNERYAIQQYNNRPQNMAYMPKHTLSQPNTKMTNANDVIHQTGLHQPQYISPNETLSQQGVNLARLPSQTNALNQNRITPEIRNHMEGSQLNNTNTKDEMPPVHDAKGDMRTAEDDDLMFKYGYPPQVPDADTQVMEEKVSSSPKLERPRSLSIQLSEEQTEDKKIDDVESEVPAKETDIEEEVIEKLTVSENGAVIEQKDEISTPDKQTPGKRTPSHLTEQGFFDLKFYHNKLW